MLRLVEVLGVCLFCGVLGSNLSTTARQTRKNIRAFASSASTSKVVLCDCGLQGCGFRHALTSLPQATHPDPHPSSSSSSSSRPARSALRLATPTDCQRCRKYHVTRRSPTTLCPCPALSRRTSTHLSVSMPTAGSSLRIPNAEGGEGRH